MIAKILIAGDKILFHFYFQNLFRTEGSTKFVKKNSIFQENLKKLFWWYISTQFCGYF